MQIPIQSTLSVTKIALTLSIRFEIAAQLAYLLKSPSKNSKRSAGVYNLYVKELEAGQSFAPNSA